MTDTLSAYREVIADLKSRRDAINDLIGELEALVGGQGPLRGMTVVEAAKAVLRENGEPMSPAAITEQIKAGGCEVSSANTVASILHRYAKDNEDVFSPERGLWGVRSEVDDTEPASGRSAAAEALASTTSAFPLGPAGIAPVPPISQDLLDSLSAVASSAGKLNPDLLKDFEQACRLDTNLLKDIGHRFGTGKPRD